MTFFCFIETTTYSVPHMEPLIADDLDEAKLEAEALLDLHTSGFAAHIFEHYERVASLERSGRNLLTERRGSLSRSARYLSLRQ